jgi:hypothetical protein
MTCVEPNMRLRKRKSISMCKPHPSEAQTAKLLDSSLAQTHIAPMSTKETESVVAAVRLLREWLGQVQERLNQSGQRWLSSQLDVSQPTVFRWWAGQLRPGPEFRAAIDSLSEGKVPFESWYKPKELATSRIGKGKKRGHQQAQE